MLVLSPGVRPTLLVPTLERPDAEAAEASDTLNFVDWPDGSDPYLVAGDLRPCTRRSASR